MSDITKTPREELECKKKYLYEYSMFWECNDGSKCQILEDDVVRLLNEQQATINKVYELLEEADIFSDKATEHDIKAYIELQEFDNKDAYYLACGIKKAIKLLKGEDV